MQEGGLSLRARAKQPQGVSIFPIGQLSQRPQLQFLSPATGTTAFVGAQKTDKD